jgi:acyl transferase domain-containing protein/acyl carrier protein
MKTSPEQVVEALRASLKESERLRQHNRRLQEATAEPIAIVGMACRYPGGVATPEQLWQLLASGTDAISGFPEDRGWDLERLLDSEGDRFGTSYTNEGGFIYDAADFDRGFFEISPREAAGMDPQQRLLLEAAWQACESAGIVPASLRGSRAGVFTGLMYHDYGWGRSPADPSAIYLPTGGSSSVACGRISYAFGLEGPSVSVDTACSSSLVALHLAIGALRAGECGLALAGGATVYSTPGVFIQFSGQRALARDGRSKAYAEAADGAGFSEGVGMLLLERLSDAQRNGHPVLATIRGSAVNQDGASNGLTAPNGPSQERVIRQALENARLSAEQIDAVEGHGTGTPLGDPIEVGALLATYGAERPAGRPLRLGSIKSNIGHPQAAAGVAGVIKMVLAMRAGLLPATLHAAERSSKIDWSSGAIELLSEPLTWEPGERPRRAAVSSFGATGTNAHLILEEAPAAEVAARQASKGDGPVEQSARLSGPVLLPLSARTEPALREAAGNLAARLRENPDLDPVDVGFSLASGRTAFELRAAVVGESHDELLAGLGTLERGEAGIGGEAAESRVAFLFPGHGSQWHGMARGLLDSSPPFAAQMAACEDALAPFVDWSLLDCLSGESDAWLEQLEIVQPALFAVMVSLARLWRELGVEPGAVAGHSLGESVAAYVSGGLSLEDATRLVIVRSRLITKLFGQGGLASVALGGEELRARLECGSGRVEIAALNGPAAAIVSAASEPLEEFLAGCEADGVWARRLPTSMASHSSHVEVLRDEMLAELEPISPRSGKILFHSTVTGEPLDTAELTPEYWYRNLRQTVLLEPAVRGLIETGHRHLIEVGPHPVLAIGLQETAEAVAEPGSVAVLSTLRREEPNAKRFAVALGEAHAAGVAVDWQKLFAATGAKRVELPTYPFQRERFWLAASSGAGDLGAAGLASTDHPLLGARIDFAQGEGLALSGRLSLATHPWLADHALAGTALLPGTAFLELALLAGGERGCETIEELTVQAPLILAESGAVTIQVFLADPDEDGRREIVIHSRPDGEGGEEWTCHALGVLSPQRAAPPDRQTQWPPPTAQSVEVELAYERLAGAGFEYGPAFQGLTAAWQVGDELYAEVSLPAGQAEEAGRYALHPALLDAAAHAGIDAALRASQEEGADLGAALPFSWRGTSLHAHGAAALRLCLHSNEQGGGLTAHDEQGKPVISIDSVVMRPVDPAVLRAAARRNLPLHHVEWVPVASEESAGEAPELALLDCRVADRQDDVPAAAQARTAAALERVKAWLGDAQAEESRLCVLTAGAVAARPGEDPDLGAAPIWGLLRSAQSEHPGRLVLLDSDGSQASEEVLPKVLATGVKEPQLALRAGELLAPRLTRAQVPEPGPEPIDPQRTVLITGATGALGALLARHLVAEHGARQLLLVSRSGPEAGGAAELQAELESLGADVQTVACNVADRPQLEQLLAAIPGSHPLGAVFHCAGVLDDGVLESLDAERLERVMGPKATAAWHLHELTADVELSAFVLFSSVMGILGGAAQANYAAANAFLDALAAHRQARGLPGVSLAWGGWAQLSGMLETEQGGAELARIVEQVRQRLGLVPMPPEQGLALLDAALGLPEPLLVPAALDSAVLRSKASSGTLPAVLSGLVSVSAECQRGSLAERLAGVPEEEHEGVVLELVRGHVAAVLGHLSAAEVEPDKAFRDLGFDSLAAVELRNRLVAASGLQLPTTVVFDYPSCASLAAHLADQVAGKAGVAAVARRHASSSEPIAIVGMACRYPGGASSPAALWELVARGGDAISAFPEDRGWDLDRLYDPDPERLGSSYAREGGFVYDAPSFDPGFFGISPREALGMDPQERTLLETCWEALEDGGLDPHALHGSGTGVFAGVMYQDYGVADYGAGMTSSGVSGRVSYTFGFEGPAITVDTACSSSLVAMHLAAQALRGGECEIALAGGVTVLSTPGIFAFFSRQRALAPDGRCKPFAEAADGTAIAEGSGVVLLERLSDAQRNGHSVLATLRGSAVNQDGASNGFSAPNGPSQERVIRQALANAGLGPEEVDLVEAHGTGTMLGDPIEAGALLATYGQDRERPLKLGSLKSNIGHTQAAAGVAGVIKTVMAMREGVMPKTLHLDSPSTKVEWQRGQIELLAEPQPWPVNGRPRRAGVSSFGASGTNAHLILEAPAASAPAEEDARPAPPGPLPLVLSARSKPALAEAAGRLAAQLGSDSELEPLDVAYSLASSRASFEHRAVVLGASRDELITSLAGLAAAELPTAVVAGKATGAAKLAYLFTGQGAQRAGMGAELRDAYPLYGEVLAAVLAALAPHMERPLEKLLFATPGCAEAELLDNTAYAQPALFATEVALFRLLASFGLQPDLLAGHSIGELVAAHLAGVLSLADAAKLVAARGRLMGELPSGGAMLAIQASEQEAVESIAGWESELAIAAINGPGSVVLSGAAAAIEQLQALWGKKGRKTKRLAVSHAFHSPLIEPMLERFASVAAELTYNEPRLAIVSTRSGELLSAAQATDPAYWVAQVREPVRFAEAVTSLAGQGASAYMEIGPDGVLSAIAQEIVGAEGAQFAPALRQGRPEAESLIAAIAHVHVAGAKLDWPALFAGRGARRVPLPTYPFQRKRYWLSATETGGDLSSAGLDAADHPLLAAAIESPAGEGRTLTGRISLQTHPWLADHAAFDTVLLPGTALVELALRAGAEVGCELLEELTLQAPLALPERGGVQLQVTVGEAEEGARREIAIHSRPQSAEAEGPGEWAQHAAGLLAPGEPSGDPRLRALATAPWPPEGAEALEVDGLYERLAARGIEYGPAFRCVKTAWRRGEEAFAELSLPEGEAEQAARFGLHPALLDAAGHVAADLAIAAEQGDPDKLTLPFAWHGVRFATRGAPALRVQLDLSADGGGLVALDASGTPVVSVESVTLRPVERSQLHALARDSRSLYGLEWQAPGQRSAAGSLGRLAILGEAELGGLAEAERHASLAALLEAIEVGGSVPEVLVAPSLPDTKGEGPLAACHANAAAALELAQAWIGAPALAASRLVLLTEGAVAARASESPDLGSAPLWGLLRSAQSEHPDRFALIDSDGAESSTAMLATALAACAEEPQLALREGELLVPRLVRTAADPAAPAAPPFEPEATVLISGGTSGLGALFARHLATEHGARHLLLVSRSGGGAAGAGELQAELEELGASVRIAACDVADRAQLAALLDSIPAEQPLGAVIHSAGVLDDGVLESLDRERLDRVLVPKADAAWNLHELTAELGLSQFLLFSSVAGILGAPGQANYAAANTFLDALAAHRQAAALPATSMAWGGWALESGMVAGSEAELARAIQQVRERLGLRPMSPSQGLDLFEAARELGEPLLVPAQLDSAALRIRAKAGTLPAVLRGLVRVPREAEVERGSLLKLLADVPEAEREAATLELIRGHIAAVLGHESAAEIDPERPFQELGFDSLAAVELRNRLTAATGMRLAPTLVFDYPTAAALAGYLVAEVAPDSAGAERELREAELREAISGLEAMLTPVKADPEARERVSARLRSLLVELGDGEEPDGEAPTEGLEAMSHEEMFELIDQEFGGDEAR